MTFRRRLNATAVARPVSMGLVQRAFSCFAVVALGICPTVAVAGSLTEPLPTLYTQTLSEPPSAAADLPVKTPRPARLPLTFPSKPVWPTAVLEQRGAAPSNQILPEIRVTAKSQQSGDDAVSAQDLLRKLYARYAQLDPPPAPPGTRLATSADISAAVDAFISRGEKPLEVRPLRLLNVPESEYAQYFTARLALQLQTENHCIRRSGGFCILTSDPLIFSTDFWITEPGIGTLNAANVITVSFRFYRSLKYERIRYRVEKTADGWRIADICYHNGQCLHGLLAGLD